MPSSGPGARRSLLVVDLESRDGARGVLEWRARRIAGRLGARDTGGDQLPQVLLHPPLGSGPSSGWPAGVRVVRTVDELSPGRLRDIHERVFARSLEMVRGQIGKVFPNVCGISLGELSLQTIQGYLTSFSIISAALGDLIDTGEVEACHIISGDVGFATALERQVAGRAAISTWPPRWLLDFARWAQSEWSARPRLNQRRAEYTARDAMAALLREQGLRRARPRVLVVSESTPMADMFGVVQAALTQAGVGPIVRLDFSSASARSGGGALVCSCGAQGTLGPRGGIFQAQWGDAQRELRRSYALTTFERSQDARCLEGLLGILYASQFDALARHLWVADTALELLQPDVVLLGNDRWWGGQAFAQLARRRGIPSVSVQDGIAGDLPFWWWLTADNLAATSEHLVQMLVRHGVPPERCTVTGQPRYDPVTRSGPADQHRARAALGLDPSTFCVLFAVQGIHSAGYVRSVISALLAVPGIHVMLRPHPSDRRNLCERLMRELGSERMTLHRGGDILALVRACDALVTQHSTVVLEAALLGKPVITAYFGDLHGPAPMGAIGIATPVSGLEQLTTEVQRLVTGTRAATAKRSQSEQAALEAIVGPMDGRAGERVAKLVTDTLRRTSWGVRAAATP